MFKVVKGGTIGTNGIVELTKVLVIGGIFEDTIVVGNAEGAAIKFGVVVIIVEAGIEDGDGT